MSSTPFFAPVPLPVDDPVSLTRALVDIPSVSGHETEVADAIERELFAAFPDAEVILHQEPAGLNDERLDHRIERRAMA